MIKIALCDDNKNHQEKIKTLLLEYFKSGASIDIYAEGQKLLRHIEWEGEEAYDLYILDVIMPGLSGIELGKKLRSAGVFAPVIYLTSSKEYAVDSYNVRAFHYLVKPVEKEKLFSVLKQAQNLIAQEKAACITVDTPGGVEVLKLSDILYAELYARSVRYYLAGGTYKDSKKLRVSFQKALGELLEHKGFIMLGSSYLINLHQVKKVGKKELILASGKEIALPKGARSELLKSWMNYWLEEE